MDMMRKELQTLGQAIEVRIDTRMTTYENAQQVTRATIETQLEQAMKRYSE